MTTPNDTPAGWYDDGSGRQRWWDGQQWGTFADEASAPAAPATPDFSAPADSTAPAYGYAGATATSTSPYTYPGAPTGAELEGKKKLNILALVSAIVAAVGFIFACIPGALIIGWILLPIAFILSIVALFLKGDKKWLAFVGLGVSILGTIVGFIVFFAVVATSFEVAFSGGDTTVSEPSESDSDEAEDAPVEEDASDAQGSRENPFPVGSEISNSDWTVVINSINPDGNPIVTEANQFNEPAPAGSHYEIVNYTVTYKGAESGYAVEVMVDAVTSSGNVINSYDSFVVLSDPIGFDELYKDGTTTGSQAFLVPDGETIVLRVTPGILADEVFIK